MNNKANIKLSIFSAILLAVLITVCTTDNNYYKLYEETKEELSLVKKINGNYSVRIDELEEEINSLRTELAK